MDISALQETLRKFAAELLRLAEHASIPLHAGPTARKGATEAAVPRKSAAKKSSTAPKGTAKKAGSAHKQPTAKKAAAGKPLAAPAEKTSTPAKTARAATKKSFDQVLAILRKTPAATLPSKRARLLAFVRSRVGADADVDAQAMLKRLEDEGRIAFDDKWDVEYRL